MFSYFVFLLVFFFVLKKLKYFQVNEFLASQENTAKQKMLTEEVAMGFIQVANEAMCRPIRALTQVRHVFNSNLLEDFITYLRTWS